MNIIYVLSCKTKDELKVIYDDEIFLFKINMLIKHVSLAYLVTIYFWIINIIQNISVKHLPCYLLLFE